MPDTTFVGFGFGAIQAGLFLAEAFNTGKFERLVVAEVNPSRIQAIRTNRGSFAINIATAEGHIAQAIEAIEILNPTVREDAKQLLVALTDASEIATALPSVDVYHHGTPSPADLLREALRRKIVSPAEPSAIVYTAENDNHAAERLRHEVLSGLVTETSVQRIQMLNTVIGKMSRVVTDPAQIRALGLVPTTPGSGEAFLVEAFNRIMISQVCLPGFKRVIDVFEEKPDLLPFEEAKLFGHNAVHAVLGFLAHQRGLRLMSELANHPDLLVIGRKAFLDESGAALIRKYRGLDPLFTEDGFAAYADDLLKRMLNPYLQDPVDRVVRDPLRKLGWNDRLIGTIRLCLAHGISASHLLQGVRIAMETIPREQREELRRLWLAAGATPGEQAAVWSMLRRTR